MGASTLYQVLTSGRYLPPLNQSIPSSSQSLVTTNQITECQNQTSYKPSTTTQVSAGQSVSTSQVQGSYGAEIQRQSLNLPSSAPVWAGQYTSTSQAQSMGASTLYQSLTSGRYLPPLTENIPSSSQSVQGSYGAETSGHAKWYSILPGQEIQRQSLNLPSSTPVWAGQSMSQAQSMGASTLYQGLTSGRYLPSLDQSIPSSSQSVVSTNQITGFPNQTSYQPSTTTPVAAGQSVSTAQAQSMGICLHLPRAFHPPPSLWSVQTKSLDSTSLALQHSYGAETSGHAKWYSILPGQMIPSSSQVSEIQRQSINLTSSAPVWAGQSTSTSQAQSMGALTLYQGLTSGRYLPPLAQSVPSSSQSVVSTNQITGFPNQTPYQPSTTTPVAAGQSISTAQAQSMGGLTSGRYLPPLTQSVPTSSQTVDSTNQISGFHQPSATTAVSAGQTVSTAQAQSMGASTLFQGLTSRRYLTSLPQSVPSSSQSVVSTNRISECQNQMTYQPSTTTQDSDAHSVSTSQGSYGAETSGHVGTNWYASLPGQTIASSSQVSEFQKPSLNPLITKQLWAGQSVSISQAPFQHMLPQ
ncbi:hypothetical protein Q7C36_020348 [Tachysurus vachellii]|uniref:Uncharacterized protein n=1 Tax=Tachysurus vachellii TaxID=175792 RepID=A0AA88LUC1_TACVA|nr:hypothetical protein Q7C36_020348 [Tachysurus vachellii]